MKTAKCPLFEGLSDKEIAFVTKELKFEYKTDAITIGIQTANTVVEIAYTKVFAIIKINSLSCKIVL